MPIVTPKLLPETERLNVQIDKAIYDDLMLYTKMINEPDKAHIINSLLEYALKRDKEFKTYKAEIKRQLQHKQQKPQPTQQVQHQPQEGQEEIRNQIQNQEQRQNQKEADEHESHIYKDKPT